VADDGAGINMIARSTVNPNIIALNLYPGLLTGNNADFYRLVGNALVDSQQAKVPEPSTFLLLGAGLVGVGLLRKRFKR
jgi:hypothetical protein